MPNYSRVVEMSPSFLGDVDRSGIVNGIDISSAIALDHLHRIILMINLVIYNNKNNNSAVYIYLFVRQVLDKDMILLTE